MADLVFSPFVIMALALATGLLLYAWSRAIAPRFMPAKDKTMPYIGGEATEAQVYQPGYAFYSVAVFFTVVHIAALVIALAPPGAPPGATLGYLAIIAVAVTALRWEL